MATLKERRAELLAKSQTIIDGAKADGRANLTADELREVNANIDAVKKIDVQINDARESADLINELANVDTTTEEERIAYGAKGYIPGSGVRIKDGAPSWGKSVAHSLGTAAGRVGVKSLLQGEVSTPPAAPITALPTTPTRMADLVARVPLQAQTYSYLRQITRDERAALVADNQLKPTSVYEFKEIKNEASVVAHLSQPFPLRYMDDYKGLAEVLDTEMKEGVVRAIEREMLIGTGLDPKGAGDDHFLGILKTSGVLSVDYAGDKLKTARLARTRLDAIGETPTAWLLNPEDAAELELARENGESGAFLMAAGAFDVVFGQDVARVTSPLVPRGVGILADWSTCELRVREQEQTLAATQAGDLFAKNQVMLRCEGRYAFDMKRPQAFAVVKFGADVQA